MTQNRCALLATIALVAGACAPELDAPSGGDLGVARADLSAAQRRARATIIRDVGASHGLSNGFLLGGIADSETGMAHCWSEAQWACQGPYSDDCDGPVIAGSADGPCANQQGGLGMFQFDAGTYDQTLDREGVRILSIGGNVEAAIDFVVAMVMRSVYVDGVDSRAQAIEWMNQVRVGNGYWEPWITTVTHYYNGCVPGSCSVFDSRYASYAVHTSGVLTEMGEDFWYDDVVLPECQLIPPEGDIIDETDVCFEGGGDTRWLREVSDAGWDGTLTWTHATDNDEPANYGMWHLAFEEAGSYTVEAFTDGAYAESTQTVYQVYHQGQTDVVPVDQTAVDGWSYVGEYSFARGADQWLRVDDNTGEPVSTETRIVFDAIRLTRADLPEDGGPGSDGDADVDADVDADADSIEADADGPDWPDSGRDGSGDEGLQPRPITGQGCSLAGIGGDGLLSRLLSAL